MYDLSHIRAVTDRDRLRSSIFDPAVSRQISQSEYATIDGDIYIPLDPDDRAEYFDLARQLIPDHVDDLKDDIAFVSNMHVLSDPFSYSYKRTKLVTWEERVIGMRPLPRSNSENIAYLVVDVCPSDDDVIGPDPTLRVKSSLGYPRRGVERSLDGDDLRLYLRLTL